VLALELGPCTAAMQHLLARMGTTGMRRMAARLTVITARVGSLVDYSSELDPGSTAMADIGAVVVTTDAADTMAAVATTDVAATLVADRLLPRTVVSLAVGLPEVQWAVDSEADQPERPVALVGSMAAVEAVSMGVVEAMVAADTGN
jgi:hypothetical protein